MSAITQLYVGYSPECTYKSVLKIMGQVKVCNFICKFIITISERNFQFHRALDAEYLHPTFITYH
jgi:hypothetical protein